MLLPKSEGASVEHDVVDDVGVETVVSFPKSLGGGGYGLGSSNTKFKMMPSDNLCCLTKLNQNISRSTHTSF